MDKYYYFISQLPFLVFDRQKIPGIDVLSFLDEASKWLLPYHFELIKISSIENFDKLSGKCDLVEKYKKFEWALRKYIASRRGENKSKEVDLYNVGNSINQNTPFDSEISLLKLRWDYIENLEVGHNFDFEKVICYYIKLQILERLLKFNKEKGTKIFDSLCEVKL